MILSATLGTERKLPQEYVDFKLCEKFRCLPSQLDKEDAEQIDLFVSFMNIEAREGFRNAKREEQNRK